MKGIVQIFIYNFFSCRSCSVKHKRNQEKCVTIVSERADQMTGQFGLRKSLRALRMHRCHARMKCGPLGPLAKGSLTAVGSSCEICIATAKNMAGARGNARNAQEEKKQKGR